MKALYLIGNGFDLQHGVHTSYSDFRKYLEQCDEDFLTRFELMYNIQPLNDMEPYYNEAMREKRKESVVKSLWRTFEDNIGHPDIDGMHDFAIALTDGMPAEGVKDTYDNAWKRQYGFVSKLQHYVLEWISSIDTSNITPIKKDFIENSSDKFLSFNYTDILERVYKVENVFHLHGGALSCSKIPPILGHGNKFIIDLYKRRTQEARERFVEWEESIYSAIFDFCSTLYKDTEEVLLKNDDFFSNLKDIDQVVSIGLSFGDVDTPYLMRIAEEVKPISKWKIYYYNKEDLCRLKNVFGILGISEKFETYFLSSKKFWHD